MNEHLTTHVPVRFPPDLIASAERLAALDGLPLSTWIRQKVTDQVELVMAVEAGRNVAHAEALARAWEEGAEAGRTDEAHGGWQPPENPYRCHCGRPVTFGYDGDPTHHRGMCVGCDEVRCDAYPLECPHRGQR